jgi:phospholipase/carboxylesterase
MPIMKLEYEIDQVGDKAEYCVIWLHGLGADGHDFAPVVPELGLPTSPGIRFIFPHAPQLPVTINGGYVMRAWYDVLGMDLTERQDRAGIENSAKLIEQLIDEQIDNGIAERKIVLAGFSQGGAMALHIGLRSHYNLAGIMALSTYLPLANELPLQQAKPDAPPVFMAHGRLDQIVPMQAGKNSRVLLESLGYKISWKEYPMEHSVCGEEIADISYWLQSSVIQP